ncbi:6-phosphogluconolactonase [Propioniciclava sp.]|uniref:6-phosphogluconolactonase n=1 Tax=Propioniciclava sp. TaxID=2038686 RepID=UPI00262DB02F|nr:6-phosphogluconolactonase [Propioniciclava sp.]
MAENTAVESVARYATGPDLVDGAAERLLANLVAIQAEREGNVHLCLTGGRIANRIYAALCDQLEGSGLDPRRLELWWGDERFVPTEDPDRNAGHTLAILAGKLPLTSAQTHPMSAKDGFADATAVAASYAKELENVTFDICLLGMGTDGHVASIFPNHPSFEATSHAVVGVTDSPKPPSERISLTIQALNTSRQIWFLVGGADKADAVRRSVGGDPTVPAGVVRGRERTLWLLDRSAASDLPYHECSF